MTMKGGEEVFAGFNNYRLVFEDPIFTVALTNNLKLFLLVPFMTVLALIVASVLFNRIRGWQFYRSIVFIPYILSVAVVGIVFSFILQYNGVLNTIMRSVGLETAASDWLGDSKLALGSVAFVIAWKQFGFGVILILSRMMSIDVSLYEAAEVDGANWMHKLFHITIPQARHIIEFYVIISLIEMLSWVFGYIFVMTAGGPGGSTYVLEYLIYKKSFGGGNFYIAQAIGVIVLIMATILIVIHQLLVRKGEKANED
jgi:ABC-type sugar transport system permease subunit